MAEPGGNRTGIRRPGKLTSLLVANLRLGGGLDLVRKLAAGGDAQAIRDLEPIDNSSASPIAWEAFCMLNSQRDQISGGIAGLRVSEMLSILDILGMTDRAQTARMIRLICGMDAVYRDWIGRNVLNARNP